MGDQYTSEQRKFKEQVEKRRQLDIKARAELSVKAERWFTVVIVCAALLCF